MKIYTDLQGREFRSLTKLCEENHINYNRCYQRYHKGIPLSECIRDGIERREQIGSTTQEAEREDAFIPQSIYPSVEYVRWLKYQIDKRESERKTYIFDFTIDENSEQDRYIQILKTLPQFWLRLVDAVACNEESYISQNGSEQMVAEAQLLLQRAKDGTNDIYKDIYVTFSKQYHLGEYAPDNLKTVMKNHNHHESKPKTPSR